MRTKSMGIFAVMIVFGMIATTGAFANDVIEMGLSLAITGPTSDAGNPYAKGVEDYMKYANETKMLGDYTVNCPVKDDQYKTENTKRIFEEYLDRDLVLFLSYATGANLALGKDFDEEQIPVIPASFDINILKSKYIFMPISSYSHQNVGLAEYVAKHHKGGGVPKVAWYIHPSAFGRGPLGDVQEAAKAGVKIEIVEVVEHGTDLDNSATLQRLQSKGVQYIISQTIQSPVATLLKDAQRLGMTASSFGEKGKITFLGAHYTGGNDLIALAGSAAEGFFWTTSYALTTEKGPLTDFQFMLAKKYGRDDKAANSHNYTNGIMAAQLAVEAARRVIKSGKEVNRDNLVAALNGMNGKNAFETVTTVGPVTFSEKDHIGVDTMQLYHAQGGAFKKVGEPFVSEYMAKMGK